MDIDEPMDYDDDFGDKDWMSFEEELDYADTFAD